MHQCGHWMRHTAMGPEYMSYKVLKLLKEKPMSGSEIMDEIEKRAEGRWGPSAGSIYPLLSWLQDKGYIKEVDGAAGVRRYALTDEGKAFLEEQVKRRDELRERFRSFGHGRGFMGPPWREFFPESAAGLRAPTRDLAVALMNLYGRLREKGFSEEAVKEAGKVLEEAVNRIEEVTKKLSE